MATTCDPRVYELAAAFLEDDPNSVTTARVMNLACAIQQAAEDWLESEANDRERQREAAVANPDPADSCMAHDGEGRR